MLYVYLKLSFGVSVCLNDYSFCKLVSILPSSGNNTAVHKSDVTIKLKLQHSQHDTNEVMGLSHGLDRSVV